MIRCLAVIQTIDVSSRNDAVVVLIHLPGRPHAGCLDPPPGAPSCSGCLDPPPGAPHLPGRPQTLVQLALEKRLVAQGLVVVVLVLRLAVGRRSASHPAPARCRVRQREVVSHLLVLVGAASGRRQVHVPTVAVRRPVHVGGPLLPAAVIRVGQRFVVGRWQVPVDAILSRCRDVIAVQEV